LLSAEDKRALLVQELIKLNDFLPSTVYIPFTSYKMRNYIILHIPPQEARVFKTKSRAPYMIAVEMYLPLEIAYCESNEAGSIEAITIKDVSKKITISRIIEDGLAQEAPNNVNLYVKQIKSTFQDSHKITVPMPMSNSKMDVEHIKHEEAKARRMSQGEIYKPPRTVSNEEKKEDGLSDIYTDITEQSPTNSRSSKMVDKYKIIQKLDPFGEKFSQQAERLRKASPYGSLLSWKVMKFIVKTNDNLLQEQFAMQLIMQFKQIFQKRHLNLWLYPYEILCTGPDSGLIECINDIVTLDSLFKKSKPLNIQTLSEFFDIYFAQNDLLHEAKMNFAHSLSAYSLICYILQIKDRHNANILLDRSGHIIHIDFGYLISNNPGNFQLDNAPFKLPADWINVLGGLDSIYFQMFTENMIDGFMAIQAEFDKIQVLIEAMYNLHEDLPCFQGKFKAIQGVGARIFPTIVGISNRRALNPQEAKDFIDQLIARANNNFRARIYDAYQYCFQGIY
jgi:phosphatidylinositol 4-kinase